MDEERAAFPTREVLGFVKGLKSHRTERPQIFPFISAEKSMCVIFDDCQMIARDNLQDRIHLTAHTCLMHGDNRLGPRRDRGLELGLIQVQRVWADIDKDRPGAAQYEGISVDTM